MKAALAMAMATAANDRHKINEVSTQWQIDKDVYK